jgi:TolB-like protein
MFGSIEKAVDWRKALLYSSLQASPVDSPKTENENWVFWFILSSVKEQTGDMSRMRKYMLCRALLMAFCILTTRSLSADDLQLTQITTTLLKGIQQTGKSRVAVVDFVDLDGNTSRLGKFIAEELSVELTQSAVGIEVVDRAHLSAILHEHKLKSDGLLDPATTKELGQLAGVDIIVTGSITDLGNSIRIVAKALSTDTARIVAASAGTLAKTPEVIALLSSAETGQSLTGSKDATKNGNESAGGTPAKPIAAFEDLLLAMEGCENQGAKIMCYGHLTNKSSGAKRVQFNPSSHLIDNSGNESRSDVAYSQYRMTIQVGADRSQMFCCLDKVLEPEIPLGIWFFGSGLATTTSSVSIVLETSEGTAILKDIHLKVK